MADINASLHITERGGKRMYSITASRVTSGLVLKWQNGEYFVIRRRYEVTRLISSGFI
jgi:hypothetical protein